jgi:hypothetical protein
MRKPTRTLAGILALSLSASHVMAQESPPPSAKVIQVDAFRPWFRTSVESSPDAETPSDATAPQEVSDPSLAEDACPRAGAYKVILGLNGGVAGVGRSASASIAASGLATSTTVGGVVKTVFSATVTTTTKTSATAVITPGLFTAGTAQSVVPVDRVFFDYGYFDRFRIAGPTGPTAGFNLHQFNIGAEKAIFDNLASIYLSLPFLYASQNVSGQPINGIGDVNVGFKVALLGSAETGRLLSGGMTVAAPSARNTVVSATNSEVVTQTATLDGKVIAGPVNTTVQGPTVTRRVNPTFLQPWIGGLVVLDRLFVHEYLGIVVPTESRMTTFFNTDLTVGYALFQNPDGMVTSVTPLLSAQALVPVNRTSSQSTAPTTTVQAIGPQGTPITLPPLPAAALPSSIGFPEQLYLTPALQVGLGERTLISGGIVTPLVGPKAYNVGVTFGINFFY